MTRNEWVALGIENGWCGPVVCYTHDGLPTTVDEDEEFEWGDPCVWILRLYGEQVERLGVELNHSPSNWRKGL
jgi:hypothetical protein